MSLKWLTQVIRWTYNQDDWLIFDFLTVLLYITLFQILHDEEKKPSKGVMVDTKHTFKTYYLSYSLK